jgi:hypothetical protein
VVRGEVPARPDGVPRLPIGSPLMLGLLVLVGVLALPGVARLLVGALM